jgi:predicted O-linked N-acetylglucosamine transferase (SPINDLY family)
LDTFPYSGGLTTCESLWMGVPVVTCAGETFASRHALSHLSNAGLTETIARNWEHYLELTVALAGDLPRLAEIRGRLRGQMAASPLCDRPRFARNLAAVLRDVWRAWVASPRSNEGSRGG